jgi:hypothetical protein
VCLWVPKQSISSWNVGLVNIPPFVRREETDAIHILEIEVTHLCSKHFRAVYSDRRLEHSWYDGSIDIHSSGKIAIFVKWWTTHTTTPLLSQTCTKQGIEGIDFTKVSALKYARTAQYLMIEALLDHLIILSYNTITGTRVGSSRQFRCNRYANDTANSLLTSSSSLPSSSLLLLLS